MRVILLAALLLIAPTIAMADGELCTLGPYSSGTSIATIESAISGAACGSAVVCLRRGQTWTGGAPLDISNTCSAAYDQLLICASDDSVCAHSEASGVNPLITTSTAGTNGITFGSSVGVTVRDIDFTNTANNSTVPGINGGSASYINLSGMAFTDFYGGFGPWGSSYIFWKMGTCDTAQVEFTGGNDNPSSDRYVFYNGFRNSTFSLYVHDYPTALRQTSHWVDFAENGTKNWDEGSHDVTLECSLFQPATGDMAFTMVKFNRGYNLIFRYNVWDLTNDDTVALTPGSHAAGGTEGVSGGGVAGAGASIYGNVFKNPSTALWNELGEDIDFYNNIVIFTANDAWGAVREVWRHAQAEDIHPSHVRIFNNTIYAPSQMATGAAGLIESDQFETPYSTPTGMAIFNNVVWDANSGSAIWVSNEAGCNSYGTNGVNIRNNYIYSPNDGTPTYWSGCSAASNTTITTGTNPGFLDPSNTGASYSARFDINISSAVYGIGYGSEPTDDYDQATRPSPLSIGAFDVGTGDIIGGGSTTRGVSIRGVSIR